MISTGRQRGCAWRRQHRDGRLGDVDDARAERDLLAAQAVRIAEAVEALVVVPDRRDGVAQVSRAGRRASHPRPRGLAAAPSRRPTAASSSAGRRRGPRACRGRGGARRGASTSSSASKAAARCRPRRASRCTSRECPAVSRSSVSVVEGFDQGRRVLAQQPSFSRKTVPARTLERVDVRLQLGRARAARGTPPGPGSSGRAGAARRSAPASRGRSCRTRWRRRRRGGRRRPSAAAATRASRATRSRPRCPRCARRWRAGPRRRSRSTTTPARTPAAMSDAGASRPSGRDGEDGRGGERGERERCRCRRRAGRAACAFSPTRPRMREAATASATRGPKSAAPESRPTAFTEAASWAASASAWTRPTTPTTASMPSRSGPPPRQHAGDACKDAAGADRPEQCGPDAGRRRPSGSARARGRSLRPVRNEATVGLAARRGRRGCAPAPSRGRRRRRPGDRGRCASRHGSGSRDADRDRSRESARPPSRRRRRGRPRRAGSARRSPPPPRRRSPAENRELLAAEAGRHVVVAQLVAEARRATPWSTASPARWP